jgi:hypothetical protein
MASGAPYVTWDGGQFVVRVDLEPDDAREVFYALGNDGAARGYWDAAERCDQLRDPAYEPED